jgi:hypothetical protein
VSAFSQSAPRARLARPKPSGVDGAGDHQVTVKPVERKAQMVANLLVVLCGDRAVQPVVNTGTLYG